MPPKFDALSLSASEINLLVSVIRFKTGNLLNMTNWHEVAAACGYKNVANAKTMFSRLCKNKLEKSVGNGGEAPSGGVAKAVTGQGKKKDSPKKGSKKRKLNKEVDDEETFDTKDEASEMDVLGVKDEDDEELEV
ncbi:MAG: hypothetical protein M1822_005508 [Bathelium mastoideum]|nr:MAG: hypothetical protein M1822_005508 [Bathelium mastoideum]